MTSSHETIYTLGDVVEGLEEVREQIPIESALASAAAIGDSCRVLDQLISPAEENIYNALGSLIYAAERLKKATVITALASNLVAEFIKDIGGSPNSSELELALSLSSYRDKMAEARIYSGECLTGTKDDPAATETQWKVDNSRVIDYEGTFAAVLEGETILSLIDGQDDPCIVDLMASTTVVKELLSKNPSNRRGRGFAFRLSDTRTEKEIIDDGQKNIKLAKVRLETAGAWRNVRTTVGEGSANLVLGRPVGGIYNLPFHWIFFRRAISTIWDILDYTNGVALLEVPRPDEAQSSGFDIHNWVDRVKAQGVEIRHANNCIFLRRTAKSPHKITV